MIEKLGNTHPNATLRPTYFLTPPGQLVAAPGSQGELNTTCFTRGTSNAAALASRSANFLYDLLQHLRTDLPGSLPHEFDPVLIKALLVHGASWGQSWNIYREALYNGHNGSDIRDYVGHFLGYGMAEIDRVMFCTDQRATLLGAGGIEDGVGHEFVLPLPPSLSSSTVNRRLTITLAWLTPVNGVRQNYRVAHLWFDPKQGNNLAPDRLNADYHAVQRGTVQHEVLSGAQAVPFQDGSSVSIKVNCRALTGRITEPIPYALAVTLEVAEDVDIPVYLEIRDRISVKVTP